MNSVCMWVGTVVMNLTTESPLNWHSRRLHPSGDGDTHASWNKERAHRAEPGARPPRNHFTLCRKSNLRTQHVTHKIRARRYRQYWKYDRCAGRGVVPIIRLRFPRAVACGRTGPHQEGAISRSLEDHMQRRDMIGDGPWLVVPGWRIYQSMGGKYHER